MSKKLYLFVGYPGAGKTTISELISEKTGAVHLWADKERLSMFDQPTHTEAESTQLYNKLNSITEQLLNSGKSVIFDTNFNHFQDRQILRELADKCGAETVLIWVQTPKDIAKKRAVGEEATFRNGYTTPMSEEQFEAITAKLEPPTETENPIKINNVTLDTERLYQVLGIA